MVAGGDDDLTLTDAPPTGVSHTTTTARTRRDPTGSGTATLKAPHAPLPWLAAGARIGGRYRVVRVIATGGYGEVYEAHDDRARRSVALKVVPHAARTPWATDALRGEFAVLASLHHPNLADVYDFGWLGDAAFFTQTLVAGVRLDRAALDLGTQRALVLVAQLCRALDYLHARGLLHRDVKPANVLVDAAAEHLTLLDFGIASAFGAGDGVNVVGTTGYLAPEAVRGQPLDARADLYALGVTLYKLAAGALPFPSAGRESADVLWDIVMTPPPALPAGVHEGVAAVILRLLAKDPAARFASAGEVLDALGAALGVRAERETSETLASYVLSATYVEESGETPLEALERAASRGVPSRPVVLVGEAGTGKSRALRELRHRVQMEGAPWVSVQARRGDPTHLLVRDLAEAVLTPDVASRLSAEDRLELARGVPSLRRRGERIAIPVDPERARRLRVEALGRALALRFERAAGVVAVEDLHAAESGAPAQLTELVAAADRAGAHCTFVVTGRPAPSLDALARATGAEVVGCAALSPSATNRLVASTFGDAQLLAGTSLGRALAAAPQSALWVQESLRLAVERGNIVRRDGRFHVASDVPALAAEDVLAERLKLLPEGAREVALAAAVWGEPATASELAAVAGRTLVRAAAGLRELSRAGVVSASRDGRERATYAMHDRFAELVPALFDADAVRETHRRAAALRLRAKDANATARAAEHLRAAGEAERADATSLAAARLAERDGRPDLSLRFLDRVEKGASIELELFRHDLARTCGARDVAEHALAKLVATSRRATPPQRVAILLRRARESASSGDARAAKRLVAKALDAAGSDTRAEASVHQVAGELAASFGSIATSMDEHRAAAALSARLRDREAEARAWLGVSLAQVQMGNGRRAHDAAKHAVRAAAGSDDLALRSDAERQLGNAVRELGKTRAAREHYRHAVEAARACGCIEREAKALNNLGTVAQFLGDVEGAMQAFVRSIALKERAGAASSALIGHNNVGALELAMGRPAQAGASLERVVREATDGGALVRCIALSNLGDLDAMEGRLDRAAERYREVIAACRARAFELLESHALTGLARVLLMRGDADAAATQADALARIAETSDAAEARRRLGGVLAVLADVRGDAKAAVRAAREAVRARDRVTRFSDFFCTPVEVQWILALALAHAGDDLRAARAAQTARHDLDALAALLPAASRTTYLRAHPVHRAIVEGRMDLPRGWTFAPDRRS